MKCIHPCYDKSYDVRLCQWMSAELSYNPFHYNTFLKIVQYGDKKNEKNKKNQNK